VLKVEGLGFKVLGFSAQRLGVIRYQVQGLGVSLGFRV